MKPFNSFFTQKRFRKSALGLAVLVGLACGPSFDPNEFMSFFMPESANTSSDDSRYIFTPQLYNDTELTEQYSQSTIIDENVKAWTAYAGGVLSEKQVSQALYDEQPEAVATFNAKLSGRNSQAVSYLDFARRADDGQGNPWRTDATKADSTQLPQLLEEAQAGYRSTTDAFLKERYAFQSVKLACEVRDYKQAQQLYDQLVKPLPKRTFISDWALSRRAGATMALGDTAQAIYEFAQVFDRCPSRRKAAETSLRRSGVQFQEKALSYAQTDTERAAVYALCAIQPGQDALDMLTEIVRLTPKNPLIELIMAREINRNEYYFYSTDNDEYSSSLDAKPDSIGFVNRQQEAPAYFDKLRSFALESADNKVLNDPAFWYTAAAYLDYVGKDYKAAQTHLDQADAQPTTNPTLKKQITAQRMLLLAAQTTTITPEVEKQLIGYLETIDTTSNFRLNNVFTNVCHQFIHKYQSKEEVKSGWLSGCSRPKAQPVNGTNQAKAYLLAVLTTQAVTGTYFAGTTEFQAIEDTVRAATVQQVIAFAKGPNRTDFDKRLLALAKVTDSDLHLLLGRRFMIEHHYAEAVNAFEFVNPKVWKSEAFTTYFVQNPFAVKMPRLHDDQTDLPAEDRTNPYTPLTFAQRMADLEKQAKASTGAKAAELYYQLGCGAWNLSWYGNAWLLSKSYWSAGEPPVYLYDVPTDPTAKQKRFDALMKTDYYTTAYARMYFEQSTKAATVPLLADRSAYMAARCEANGFAVQKSIEQIRNGYVYDEDPTFVRNMRALRKASFARDYADFYKNHTQRLFNQEMIRECAMYKDFLSFGAQSGD